MICYRFLYYTTWSLTDSSVIACGLSYNGKDAKGIFLNQILIIYHLLLGNHLHDRLLSACPYEVELGTSPNYMMLVRNILIIDLY